MPLKVVPFAETADGLWLGKFGRFGVAISRRVGVAHLRGPDKEIVLEAARESFSYSVRGQHTGLAHTLAGAMEAAEKDCLDLSDTGRNDARYTMTAEQRTAEEEVRRASMADAVEADRIAHSRGWELAIDVLPELRAYAEEQGLYPFPASVPEGPPRPAF